MNDVDTVWVLYIGWESYSMALNIYKDKPLIKEIAQYISNQDTMYGYEEYREKVESIYSGDRVSFDRIDFDGVVKESDMYWLEERVLK